jgi:HTH-type transcriptional regulator / antitoxin HigA
LMFCFTFATHVCKLQKTLHRTMDTSLKLLKTETEYNIALERTIAIFHAEEGTPESDELDILLLLIKDFEDRHYIVPDTK